MDIAHISQRSILAEFLEKIPTTTGWWYRIPVLNSNMNNRELDNYLPHLGTLFGLTEDAIAVVFIEMGLLRLGYNNKKEKVSMFV